MKPVSVEAQAKHIVDYLIDRMYILVEGDDTDSAQAIYKEIKDWIAIDGKTKNDYAEVLSVEIP
ncbi:hypothetical protein EBS02_03800 [bacterium]|nr:hypothetical protein [bacterium]